MDVTYFKRRISNMKIHIYYKCGHVPTIEVNGQNKDEAMSDYKAGKYEMYYFPKIDLMEMGLNVDCPKCRPKKYCFSVSE